MLKEVVSAVTVIGFANFTRPSSLTTSPVLAALCSLLSTKKPVIVAEVLLIFGTWALDENDEAPESPKCANVSTNYPGVIALEPQTEFPVWVLPFACVPEPAFVPQKTPVPLDVPVLAPLSSPAHVIPKVLSI